jgi:hypothetical protein
VTAGAAVRTLIRREAGRPTVAGQSVIVDPGGTIGFRRASRSLGPGGVYIASQVPARVRLRAALARLRRRSRLLRLA